jgi:hypothetical protein
MEGLPEYVTVLFVSISTALIGFPFVAVAWIVLVAESRTDKTRNIPAALLWFTASSFLDALTFLVCANLPPEWSELPVSGTNLSMFALYSAIIASTCMSFLSFVLAFFYKGSIRRIVQIGAAILVVINVAGIVLHRIIQYD